MICSFYDTHRVAMEPFRLWMEAYQNVWHRPWLPTSYVGLARAMATTAEIWQRAAGRFGKPEFGLTKTAVAGAVVPVIEQVVVAKPFCRLLHFHRAGRKSDPRVLLVAPLSGHHATLLRGTVEALLPGHDVYVTDWIDASLVPVRQGPFALDDCIDYLLEFLTLLGADTHVVAVCQAAVPALAAVSLLAQDGDPNQPRSLTLIGGPIDSSVAPTTPSRMAQRHSLEWYERAVIVRVPPWYPGAMRRVFPGFIQLSGFMSLHMDRHVGAHMQLFNHLIRGDGDSVAEHKRFYDEYLSVMDLPAEFYLSMIQTVFQRRDVPHGTLCWRGHSVQPAAIQRTALMTIEGALDDISAPGQTRAAHALTPNIANNRRAHYLHPHVGHFGLFNGRQWRTDILPRLAAFLQQHNTVPVNEKEL